MNITTKYNVGDKVFTIDPNSLKVKEFEVGKMTTWTDGAKTSTSLYPKGASYADTSYDESKCFSTEADLITFITTKPEKTA